MNNMEDKLEVELKVLQELKQQIEQDGLRFALAIIEGRINGAENVLKALRGK